MEKQSIAEWIARLLHVKQRKGKSYAATREAQKRKSA